MSNPSQPPALERIKRTLVGLKMPRALEILDDTVRQLERGEVSPLEALDALLAEELSLRESRRVRTPAPRVQPTASAEQRARAGAPATMAGSAPVLVVQREPSASMDGR